MWRRLLVLTGLAALVAFFLRRRRPPRPATHETDPAEELRRTLDEARGRSETGAEKVAEPATDLDERRQDVHARARAAADEMRRSTSD